MTISAIGAVILGYLAEAAALSFLYSIAEALEDRAMDRARGSLSALLRLLPPSATVLRSGSPIEVPVSELGLSETLLVRPGERVATDGIVRSGRSSVDTSAITGESIPVHVEPGEPILAGTVNGSGALEVETTARGTDNSLTSIVDLVRQAQTDRGERARLADRIARPLVPGVVILAVMVALVGSFFGDPEVWITRALVVLVAASPCALAISVPVTVISAIGAATKFGMIVKSGAAFERFVTIRHVAFDKTGTLTRNLPSVTSVITLGKTSEAEVLALAAALEAHSTHPLADAITAAARDVPTAKAATEVFGRGITGSIGRHSISVGSSRWIAPGPLADDIRTIESAGETSVMVARDGELIGAIGVRDELREEAAETIALLQRQGVAVSMLTGDNRATAHTLARSAGINDVHAELRPKDKSDLISQFVEVAPTAMVGDGVNDAPALARSTVGIAMGVTGSDAAIESADIAFTGHDLRLIPLAVRHARLGRAIINQNIALSLLIVAALVPLAITGVLGLAAVVLVHEVAEIIVIANGLRAARSAQGKTGLSSMVVPSHRRRSKRSWDATITVP